MDIKVDAKGLACPMPVIKTKKALEEIESGVVEVTVDAVSYTHLTLPTKA